MQFSARQQAFWAGSFRPNRHLAPRDARPTCRYWDVLLNFSLCRGLSVPMVYQPILIVEALHDESF